MTGNLSEDPSKGDVNSGSRAELSMKGMCWQAGGGNLAGRQMAASERPSKWEQAGALADKQKSGAQGLGSRKQEMFTKSRKAALPPCPGDAVLLPQDTIRESGPGR